ncbi:MAG: hypothetical protein II502_05095 [Paludibacteraceae bacterium]|nr:hypothetical protein [Paludibacteraceae bacterium]
MKKILLIDSMAFIFRAFYGFNGANLTNAKGESTVAIYGFCLFLDDLIKLVAPTHIAVAFESPVETFRKKAYPQYKATRKETPHEIIDAIPVIQNILKARRIPILQQEGYEADDVIGTVANMAKKKGFEVFMATPDKDYAQLVSEQVYMCRPKHGGGYEILNTQDVCQKYGLNNTQQVIDLLALMGDKSDNIPGCTGIGEKTAVKLLQQFGSIDGIYAHREEVKGGLESRVLEQEEQVRFSYFLAKICTDAPIDFQESAFAVQPADTTALLAIYKELNFNSFIHQLYTSSTPQQLELF